MNSDDKSQSNRELFGSHDWDNDLCEFVIRPPTKDRQEIGLVGLFYEVAWISIDEETFQQLANNAIGREEFREIIWGSPADGLTEGIEFGLRVGAGRLVHRKHEALKYPDCETTMLKFPQQTFPIQEQVTVCDGQYILFSVDEWPNERFIQMGEEKFDEAKLNLFTERFRFGELYFDMLRMEYADQKIVTAYHPPRPGGNVAFIIDPSGMIYYVAVHDD